MFGLSLAKFVFMHQSSPLNKFICTQNSARVLFLVMRTHFVLIFWNKMAGKTGRAGRCVSFPSRARNMLDVHKYLLYAVFRIENDESVAGWKGSSAVAYCESCL